MAVPVVPPQLLDNYNQNILDVEEKLDQNEITQIANQFKNQVDLEKLSRMTLNQIHQYIGDNIQNKQLKAILQDTINLTRGIKEIPKEVLQIGQKQDPRSGAPVGQTKLFAPTPQVVELEKDLIAVFRKFRAEKQRIEVEGNFDKEKEINLSDPIGRTLIAFKNISDRLGKSLKRSDKAQFIRDGNIAIDPTKNPDEQTKALIRIADKLFRTIRQEERKIEQATAFSPDIEKLSITGEPAAKRSLKEFTKGLKSELEAIEKGQPGHIEKVSKTFREGVAVHLPHDEHIIGHIKILSDHVKNIKEIIIEPFTSGKELLNLAHALAREDGILLDINGNDVLDIMGKNKDTKIIADKILELINKLPKGHALRLVYKPVHSFGGHFVGGAFTNAIYNKPDFRDSVFTGMPKGGFIGISNFDVPKTHDFLSLPIQA